MLNFIFDNIKYDKCGAKYRYNDFISFLNDYYIIYKISNNIKSSDFNIIDINYICENPYIILNDLCYIFCGTSKKLFEYLSTFNYYKKINYQQYISHNLYYTNCFNGIFLPMFLYNNDIKLKNVNKKYKYGVFITHYDVNYLMLDKIINILNISYDDILFLDNEKYIKPIYHKTNDKDIFYSSIDIFLDFANDYTNRHVMSRTYLELIANNIPIQIVSFNNSKPISFKGFSHIKYKKIQEFEYFDLLEVIYEQKYFKTETYSNYIKYILNNLNKPIKLPTVEEYTNENFNVFDRFCYI